MEPTPKFKFFQSLNIKNQELFVVGIEYVDPAHALLQHLGNFGFCYKLSPYCLTCIDDIEEMVFERIDSDGLYVEYWEDELAHAVEAKANA